MNRNENKNFGAIIAKEDGTLQRELFADIDEVIRTIGSGRAAGFSHDYFKNYIDLIHEMSDENDKNYAYEFYTDDELSKYDIDSLLIGAIFRDNGIAEGCSKNVIGNISFYGDVAFVLYKTDGDEYLGMPDFTEAFKVLKNK